MLVLILSNVKPLSLCIVSTYRIGSFMVTSDDINWLSMKSQLNSSHRALQGMLSIVAHSLTPLLITLGDDTIDHGCYDIVT